MSRSTTMAALVLATTLLTACAGANGPGAEPQPHDPVTPAATKTASAPQGNVTGVVTDAAGKPLAGVMVQPISLDSPPQPVPEIAIMTDAEGRFTWSLPPGKYEFRAGGAKTTVAVPSSGNVRADMKTNG